MSDNPVEPDPASAPDQSQPQSVSATRASYNLFSDTVIGVNTRKSDNKFQAIFIGISILVLAAVGGLIAVWNTEWEMPWYAGALLGAFAGLVFGTFASGIFLMFYRAWRHIQGKHD
ncbi:hypothetical protein Pan258_03170 [Symmachiella dynata]|uniref:hypothetical protein n=1 Tax=Symmachiella dynata TaxID=2527995 RepID=UPI00118850F0|nr:hypothetical protein [Symmachiella dynata]QDT46299.1 hypothetical protein Pan258_03170 [Symmachiella dynata]